jgi:L-threonylcarbamoyladenylate synthase
MDRACYTEFGAVRQRVFDGQDIAQAAGMIPEKAMHHPCPPQLTLDQACSALAEGRLLIFPTETFYALGCDAMNPDAVGAVFSLKKRPLAMPLPVVIGSRSMLPRLTAHVSAYAAKLMEAFWPGPLSLVLPAASEVPDLITSNTHRLAVRMSSHPAVQALCASSGRVLVSSSANLSGSPPAALPEELAPELTGGAAGIFSTGPLPSGSLPSTVVDVRQTREGFVVRVLRQGAVSMDALREAGFAVLDASEKVADTPHA